MLMSTSIALRTSLMAPGISAAVGTVGTGTGIVEIRRPVRKGATGANYLVLWKGQLAPSSCKRRCVCVEKERMGKGGRTRREREGWRGEERSGGER